MTGRHEKEYGSEFDNYEEPDDDYEEEDSATESNGGDGFDFESRPPPGIESFDEEDAPEEEEESSWRWLRLRQVAVCAEARKGEQLALASTPGDLLRTRRRQLRGSRSPCER